MDRFSAWLTDAAAWQSNTAKRWRLDSAYAVFDGHLRQLPRRASLDSQDRFLREVGSGWCSRRLPSNPFTTTTVQHSIIVTAVYIGGSRS